MSRSFTIRTPRLTLVPRTIELAETELQRPEAFPKLLGAIAPGNWPPELLIDARPQFLEALRGNPTLLRWFDCYILLRDESGLEQAESLRLTGFQYTDWQFDGDDIIYMVRCAYDGSHNFHDANRMVFAKIEGFRALV